MADDHLLRRHAPLSDAGWQQVDDEATERLTPHLAARRVVDWSGPHGWAHSAVNLGRTTTLDDPPPGASPREAIARQRRVLPLAEYRVPFTVSRDEVEDADRGAVDVEFDDLDRAARQAALIENRAVFHGWPAVGIVGIADASSHTPLKLGEDTTAYPQVVARAVDTLRCAGIEGPYALVIGPPGYTRIVETTEHGGYLLADHLRRILGGRILWAPGVDGAVVMTTRGGGDFSLEIGQDLSVGYRTHDPDSLHLYLEESFTFRVVEPDAAIALTD
jgi:uncharacterized linocin/CFP29 family protein